MSEKIIIDGMDVSGCGNLINDAGQCRTDIIEYCEWKPNCIYKQLKRTELQLEAKDKEIEELKGKLEVATEALELQLNNNICELDYKYAFGADCECCEERNSCRKYTAYQALKQIESEEE